MGTWDCTPAQCPVTMLRPLLLLVPCLLALGWDMDDLHARGHLDRDIPGFDQEFEDMEDELEDDFEEDRSLNDDFNEHADDMEDLEDLTPEEVEDREAILDDREGRLAGPIVRCGRWTNRVVELDGNTTAKFESTKITNRCTVLYKPTNCTGPIKLLALNSLWTTGTQCTVRRGTPSSQSQQQRTTQWSSPASGANVRDPQTTSLPSVLMETSRCGTSAARASSARAGSQEGRQMFRLLLIVAQQEQPTPPSRPQYKQRFYKCLEQNPNTFKCLSLNVLNVVSIHVSEIFYL